MSLFSNVKIYAGGWSIKSKDKLGESEFNSIRNAVTVSSEYGVSVCFFLKRGGQFYVPMSKDSNVGIGEVLDLKKITVLTLERDGEADIQRIEY